LDSPKKAFMNPMVAGFSMKTFVSRNLAKP